MPPPCLRYLDKSGLNRLHWRTRFSSFAAAIFGQDCPWFEDHARMIEPTTAAKHPQLEDHAASRVCDAWGGRWELKANMVKLLYRPRWNLIPSAAFSDTARSAEERIVDGAPDLVGEADSGLEGLGSDAAAVESVGLSESDASENDEAETDFPDEIEDPEIEYVDVVSCSESDEETEDGSAVDADADAVPPVLTTYATSVQWERRPKAETFSYSLQLAQENAEQVELELTEPRSDPEGRRYLHILTVDEILHIMGKLRAKDVEVLSVRDLCEWADHLVFVTGRSDKHLRGIADALVYQVKRRSQNVGSNLYPTVEGRDSERWMVVDCGSIVVHIFEEDARKYYNLEDLWRRKQQQALEA